MICIATRREDIANRLRQELEAVQTNVQVIDLSKPGFMAAFYAADVAALVSDAQFPGIPREAMADILNALGRRIPVILLEEPLASGASEESSAARFHLLHDRITIISQENHADILSSLNLFGATNKSHARPNCQAIPYYNHHIPLTMLHDDGALGILTIDSSGFSNLGLEYGSDVYNQVKEVFNSLLFSMWGGEGCFRDSDIICRKSLSSNTYYVFLNRSRVTGSLPLPGALERAADRIAAAIQNALWHELSVPAAKRRIPECVKALPLVGVGFFGVMNNRCLDAIEIIESGLEASRIATQSQMQRLKDRQRELMQTLIASHELLYPHFQAVFSLPGITEDLVKEAKESRSIAPLKPFLYGFESLIRVDKDAIQAKIDSHAVLDLDPKYLRPDVLFAMAKATKVALELDQACLNLAAKYSVTLPGTLMVNILPRNLYYIDRMIDAFAGRRDIMFELSESETISNLDLMLRSRELLKKHNMGIAADDFGRGYASLERILKIAPNIIKFDRSMIQDIHEDPVKQAYVKGMIEAGKILDTLILAEGVEKWEELVVLQAMGIDLIQGFLLHKPQPVADIEAQLLPRKLESVA